MEDQRRSIGGFGAVDRMTFSDDLATYYLFEPAGPNFWYISLGSQYFMVDVLLITRVIGKLFTDLYALCWAITTL